MTNEVCFATLQYDQPWSMESYLKSGGYRALKKILEEKISAEDVIEECAAFPNGTHDDLVDSLTQALMRYRQGNFVQIPTDDWEEGEGSMNIAASAYYG